MDSLEATINNAVTVAVATALQASEARVARNEERITQLVQQLDETNHKFDAKYNQLERKFDEKTRALERALLRLHGQQDNHEQKSRRWNVRIENIPFDTDQKSETDDQLRAKIKAECAKVDIVLTDADIARHHRSGKPVLKNDQLQAQTIVKLSNWRARKQFQRANKTAREKKVRFFCANDLSRTRLELLQYARRKIDLAMAAKFSEEERRDRKIPDVDNVFTFSTPDGQILLRIRQKVFPFTSEEDFNELFRNNFNPNCGRQSYVEALSETATEDRERPPSVPAIEQPATVYWLDNPVKPTRTEFSKIPNIEQWLAVSSNVWVGRDMGVLKNIGFGNPFRIGVDGNRQEVIEKFKKMCVPILSQNVPLMNTLRSANSILCGCRIHEHCHIDLLLNLI